MARFFELVVLFSVLLFVCLFFFFFLKLIWFQYFALMASKKERRTAVWLEAQRILRDSLKAPQLSNNLAEVVDHPSAGIIPAVLVSEDNSGLVLLDGEDQLVKEPEFSVVSRVGVVNAGELMVW